MANPHHQDAAAALNGSHHSPINSSDLSSGPATPDISCEWSHNEKAVLEYGLVSYASSEKSSLNRYAKIATHLQNKTIRDVALRCRWMSEKQKSKVENRRNNKDRKECGTPFPFTSQSNASCSYTNTNTNTADGISYNAIGGEIGRLLEQNAHAFRKISFNHSTMLTQENIDLFRRTSENILSIVNSLNAVPEAMSRLPPLPVTLNEELARTIIPPPCPSPRSSL